MLKTWFDERFKQWLDNHLPVSDEQILTRGVIFILPSRFGCYFMLCGILLFLLGTNYQNNLILLFSFLMAAIMFVTMFHTFFALYRLKLKLVSLPPMERDSVSDLTLSIHTSRPRHQLKLYIDNYLPIKLAVKGAKKVIKLPHHPKIRGKQRLPRLTIETNYPLGLFRCWSHVGFEQDIFVYPKPKRMDRKQLHALLEACSRGAGDKNEKQKNQRPKVDSEDVEQLDHYQKGQSLSRVSWKHVASGQGWYTKSFTGEDNFSLSVEEQCFAISDLEERLCAISAVVRHCQEKSIAFSFKLGNERIEQVSSNQDIEQCYKMLAVY